MNPAHSHAPISTSSVMRYTVATGGRPSITPSSTAMSTMAVSTRSLSTLADLFTNRLPLAERLFARESETALARIEGAQRVLEMRHVEIRPQCLAEVQLGVGEIPQQEIADAVIAAGADEQVRVAGVGQRQLARETLLVDGVERHGAARHLRGDAPRGLHDIPASAVAHRHLQLEARVGAGELFGGRHARLQLDAERVAVADETQPHLVLVQFFDLAVQGFEEQLHEARDLDARPPPVLAREREQRQRADAAARALLDAHSHRAHALLVAGMARQAAGLGPSSVAVHDDGYVIRNTHGSEVPGRPLTPAGFPFPWRRVARR